MPAFDLNRELENNRRREEKIKTLDWYGIRELWEVVVEPRKRNASPDEDWRDPYTTFEYVILRAFELEGARVTYPFFVYPLGDRTVLHEIDGSVFTKTGKSVLCEFKSWADPIQFDPIAKLRSQLLQRPKKGIACFFSMSGFTTPAIRSTTLIATEGVLLWKKNEIEHALYNRCFLEFLEEKHEKLFTLLLPDYEPFMMPNDFDDLPF